MEKVQIKSSRWKVVLLLLAALGFVFFGAFMMKEGLTNNPKDFGMIVMGLIPTLFFGVAIPLGVKRLMKQVVELELTETHLSIQPDTRQNFQIPWSEILEIESKKINRAKLILIHVKDPKEWIDKENNPFKKKLLQFNFNQCGTPFNSSTGSMNISHNKLIDVLTQFKKQADNKSGEQ